MRCNPWTSIRLASHIPGDGAWIDANDTANIGIVNAARVPHH